MNISITPSMIEQQERLNKKHKRRKKLADKVRNFNLSSDKSLSDIGAVRSIKIIKKL